MTARGVIYLLIGWVAVLVAIGRSARQANQQGALELLARQPFGLALLFLLGTGLAGYALWRLSEAVFGVAGQGKRAGPRLASLAIAAAYAGLSYLAFSIVTRAQHGSETHRQQDLTARIMAHPGGTWLVGFAGLIVVVVGVGLVASGIGRRFMKPMRMARMSASTRRIVEGLGVTGTIARGVVFALIGGLVIDAAVTHQPSKSGGLDKALLTLRNQPYGAYLLLLAAAGLIIFGAYGLCEARWRQV
jgi:Domain of Unknown Function (DUF1206)